MISGMDEFIKEKASERSMEVINSIASANEQYRQLSKELNNYEIEIERQMSAQAFELFTNYQELFFKREALIIDLIYKQGLVDGSVLAGLIEKFG